MDEAVLERIAKRRAAYDALAISDLKAAFGAVTLHLENVPKPAARPSP